MTKDKNNLKSDRSISKLVKQSSKLNYLSNDSNDSSGYQQSSYKSSVNKAIHAEAETVVNQGLRSYMLRVYNYMSLGVALTGLIALFVSSNPALMSIMLQPVSFWVTFGGLLLLGFTAPKLILSGNVTMAQTAYWAYAGLFGLLLAPIFLIYTGESIVRVFFITSGAFAGLSLYGYTTKRNLAPFATFLIMATWGLLIALVVNMFLRSESMHYLLSIGGVLIFSGLTAWETQEIKLSYFSGDSAETTNRKAIFGAFILYGSFINLFLFLLRIFGQRR